jgi:hypothetical protein
MIDGGVQSFDPYGENSEYHPFGRNYGDPRLNILGHVLFGHNYMPKPSSGQSEYDAFLQKERSAHFMNLQRSQFANNPLFESTGMSGGLMNQLGIMASPDSSISRLLSPVLGGNPMAASMGLYASMAGANVMGNFGRTSSLTEEEAKGTMESFTNNFYKSQSYEGAGGYHEELVSNTRKFLKDRANDGEAGKRYLADLGIKPEQIDSFDPTRANTAGMQADLEKSLKETDENIRKALQDRVKKQLESHKIASKEDVDKAMQDPTGMAVSTLIANVDTRQQEVVKKIKDNMTTKAGVANRFDKLLNEIDQAKTPEERKEAEKKLRKGVDIKSDGDRPLYHEAGILDLFGESELTLKGYRPKDEKKRKEFEALLDKEGLLDPEKTKDFVAKSRDLDTIEKTILESERKPKKFNGINFENTRGYNIEDFTGAFQKASELRALGDTRGMSPQAAAKDFMQNSGEFMAAAKSLFGNKSGAELVEDTSRLVGRDKLDLRSKEGVSEISDLLRKAKATARVAGVSLNTMFGIIDSANELVRNNPQLQYASQSAVSSLAIKSIKTAADMGMQLSGEDYRKLGGAQGIAGAEVREQLDYAQSTKGGEVAAWLQAAKDNGKLPEAIAAYKRGEFSFENIQNGTGLATLSSLTGKSASELIALGSKENAVMQQQAMKDKDIFGAITEGSKNDILNDFYDTNALRGREGTEDVVKEKFKQSQLKGESVGDFFQREFVSANSAYGNYAGANSAVKYKNTIIKDLLDSQRDPEQRKAIDERIEKEAKIQEDMSKKYGRINAPAITQAMSALAGNKFDGSLTEALTGIFAVDGSNEAKRPGYTKAKKATEEAAEIIRTTSDKEITKDDKFSGKLKEIVQGRIDAAKASGDTESVKDLAGKDAKFLDKGNLELMMDQGAALRSDRSLGTTGASRKKRLDELEAEFYKTDSKMEGSTEARQQKKKTLQALRAHRELGTLEDDKAFELATSGTAAGILAGETQAEIASQRKALEKEGRKESIETMDLRLNQAVQAGTKGGAYLENSKEILEAQAYYKQKYGSDASSKMLEDYAKRDSDKEEDQDNYFKKNKLKDKGVLGTLLSTTTDDINTKKQQAAAMGQSPTEATQDLNTTMQAVVKLLGEDAGLGGQLKKLVTALGELK